MFTKGINIAVDRIDSAIIRFMDKLKQLLESEFKGKNGEVSAALYRDGHTEYFYQGAGGHENDDLYEIGSITKVFTALLFLILENRDEINRNDTIRDYLPEFDFSDRSVAEIKLEQLICHTSGLPRLPDNMPISNPEDPYADYTASHLYGFLSGHKLEPETIGSVQYSNLGYGLLGYILEIASGKTYADLIKEEILQPLNMQSTYVNTGESISINLKPGHDTQGKEAANWYMGALAGAGAIVSSIGDMAIFLQSQIKPPKNKFGKCIKMSQKILASSSDIKKHGYGWIMYSLEAGDDLVWLNGKTGGYQSFIGFVPPEEFGIVILANCKPDLDKVAATFFGIN